MRKQQIEEILDCPVLHAAASCAHAASEAGWNVSEQAEGGMVCEAPKVDPEKPAGAFQITWRAEWNRTRVTLYGPMHNGPPVAGTASDQQLQQLRELLRERMPRAVAAA